MTYSALIGASCEATGHPSECQEPVSGSLESQEGSILSVNGTEVASQGTAIMRFDSHSHQHDSTNGCHDDQSHSLVPDDTHILRVEGQAVVFEGDSTQDPGSGGDATVQESGGNTILRET